MTILITLLVLVVGTLILSALRTDSDDSPSSNKPKQPSPETSDNEKQDTDTQSETSTAKTEKKEEDPTNKGSIIPKEIITSAEPKKEEPKTTPKKSQTIRKGGKTFSKIILYGSNNSFKTQLFYSLLLDKDPTTFQTVTSVSPNTSEKFEFNGKTISLVDVPGHSNFESKISKYLEKNCLLLFILRTGSTEHNYLSKSAHKLYEILTKQDLQALQISIALVVVKETGFGEEEEKEFVKEFEKEIERIKFSRRTHVNAEEGSSSYGDYLKDIKDNFVLDHIRAKDFACIFLELGIDSLKDKINSI